MNAPGREDGVVLIAAAHPVAETAARLTALLQQRAVLVFGHIDFAADAVRAGLTMRAEQLLIFGNPRAGTPLMQSEPRVGLDLPLKALIFEDANGATWLAYNDPAYIVRRHGLPAELAANLAAVVPLLQQAAAP